MNEARPTGPDRSQSQQSIIAPNTGILGGNVDSMRNVQQRSNPQPRAGLLLDQPVKNRQSLLNREVDPTLAQKLLWQTQQELQQTQQELQQKQQEMQQNEMFNQTTFNIMQDYQQTKQELQQAKKLNIVLGTIVALQIAWNLYNIVRNRWTNAANG